MTYDPFGGYTSKYKQDRDDETEIDAVPAGTAKEILEWAEGSEDRASRALEIEQSNERPRKTLVDALKKIVDEHSD